MSLFKKTVIVGFVLFSTSIFAKETLRVKIKEVLPGKICMIFAMKENSKAKIFGILSNSCSKKVAQALIGKSFDINKSAITEIKDKELLKEARQVKKADFVLLKSISELKQVVSLEDSYDNSSNVENGMRCETYEDCEDVRENSSSDREDDLSGSSGRNSEFSDILF